MLRWLGIPARVAAGFTSGKFKDGTWTVTDHDAHAWVEAWFPGHGWLIFDPTPLTDGRTIVPPYVAEARAEAAAAAGAPTGAGPADVPRQEPTPQVSPTPEPLTPDVPVPAAPSAELPLWPVLLALVLVMLVGGASVPALLRARARRQRLAAVAAGGQAAAAAGWAELLAESTDRGVPARDSDTVRAAARRLVREHHLDRDAQEHLRQVVGVVEASWYGGQHPGANALGEPLAAVLAAVAAASPLSTRDRLLPRSVLRSATRRRSTRRGSATRRPASHDDAAAPGGRGGGGIGIGGDVSERSGATPARTGGGSAPPSGR
jgi:hypothetical protein